jgi:hypothetical protein
MAVLQTPEYQAIIGIDGVMNFFWGMKHSNPEWLECQELLGSEPCAARMVNIFSLRHRCFVIGAGWPEALFLEKVMKKMFLRSPDKSYLIAQLPWFWLSIV